MAPSPSRTTAGTSFCAQSDLEEVNFWTPSAHWGFRGEVGSPFFFKLKARYDHAVCGFAYFARYARLPDWLAWETFEARNGCPTLESMRERIGGIRARIDYRAQSDLSGAVAKACPRGVDVFIDNTAGAIHEAVGAGPGSEDDYTLYSTPP